MQQLKIFNLVNLSESNLDPRRIAMKSLADASLTNFAYGADAQCFVVDSDDYIFFADSKTINVYSTKNHYVVDEQRISEQCSHAERLEYYGDHTVLVRCPDNVAERLEVCSQNTIKLFTPNTTGIPYPCGTWVKVAYLNSSGILIESPDPPVWIDLTLTGGEHAQCVSVNEREYIVLFHDNRVVVVETGNKIIFHPLTNSSCIHPSHCFRPQIWEERFMLIGYTNGSHFLVKDLYCLLNSEIIVLDSNPRVADLLIVKTPLIIECDALQPTTAMFLQPSTVTSLQSLLKSSTGIPLQPLLQPSTIMGTILPTPLTRPSHEPPTTVPPGRDQSASKHVIIIIVVLVLLFVSTVTVGFVVVHVVSYRYRRSKKQNITRNASPTVSAQTLSDDELPSSLQGDADTDIALDTTDAHPKCETPWGTRSAKAKDEFTGLRTRRYSSRHLMENNGGGNHSPTDQDSGFSSSSAASHDGYPSHLDNEQPRLKPLPAANASQPIEQDPSRPNLPYDTTTVPGTSLLIPYSNINPQAINEARSEDRQNDIAFKASQAT